MSCLHCLLEALIVLDCLENYGEYMFTACCHVSFNFIKIDHRDYICEYKNISGAVLITHNYNGFYSYSKNKTNMTGSFKPLKSNHFCVEQNFLDPFFFITKKISEVKRLPTGE